MSRKYMKRASVLCTIMEEKGFFVVGFVWSASTQDGYSIAYDGRLLLSAASAKRAARRFLLKLGYRSEYIIFDS